MPEGSRAVPDELVTKPLALDPKYRSNDYTRTATIRMAGEPMANGSGVGGKAATRKPRF